MVMTRASADLFTDRRHLVHVAYPTGANLQARADIYAYQQPPLDLAAWAFRWVPWRGNERVIDVGCGSGRYLQRLAQHPALRLLGLDLSAGMLADLARTWPAPLRRPPCAVADAQALPLPDAACDVVLAMHMLYHVPDMRRAIGEFRRVLRPGGVLLALTSAATHTQELFDAYHAAVAAVAGHDVQEPRPPERFTRENGAAVLRSTFADVERDDFDGTLMVPMVEPVLRYIASTRWIREPALPAGVTWELVLAALEHDVTAVIANQGAFHIRTAVSLFVCRAAARAHSSNGGDRC